MLENEVEIYRAWQKSLLFSRIRRKIQKSDKPHGAQKIVP
jgi:hypothetical protein